MNVRPYEYPFFDLQREITTNPEFNAKVQRHLQNIALLEKEGRVEELMQERDELLRACDYNASLLIPYFFPNFSGGKPMSFWSRPHAIAMMTLSTNSSITIIAGRQVGKCLTYDTTIQVQDAGVEKTIEIGALFDAAKNEASS